MLIEVIGQRKHRIILCTSSPNKEEENCLIQESLPFGKVQRLLTFSTKEKRMQMSPQMHGATDILERKATFREAILYQIGCFQMRQHLLNPCWRSVTQSNFLVTHTFQIFSLYSLYSLYRLYSLYSLFSLYSLQSLQSIQVKLAHLRVDFRAFFFLKKI